MKITAEQYELNQKEKREVINRRIKFQKAIDTMPKLKGFELKKEADEYHEQLQKEKEFLMSGVAEGKVKSQRLLDIAKRYQPTYKKKDKHGTK